MSIASALQMSTFSTAVAYYLKTTKDNSTLPRNLKARAKATHDSVHSSQEVYRRFAQERCERGDKCNYAQPSQPHQNSSGSKYQGGGAAGSGYKFKGDCFYCGKPGHRKTECLKKERDDKLKQQGDDSAKNHITQEADEGHYDSAGSDDDGGWTDTPTRWWRWLLM